MTKVVRRRGSGRAYYNEFDPATALWLRQLIEEGVLPPGEVDTRSITEVQSDDLDGFTQCHFFAGIGVWPFALRQAGWADDEPIWTGSCPCQPFSTAGRQLGFSDPRHLWPDWLRLIQERRPERVLGEQVASAGAWLDLVSTDLEARGYAFAAVDLPAAGFAGAHIRQRLFWVADASLDGCDKEYSLSSRSGARDSAERWASRLDAGRAPIRLGDHHHQRRDWGGSCAQQAGRQELAHAGHDVGLGDHHHHQGLEGWSVDRLGGGDKFALRQAGLADGVDWLLCSDERIRPVEPGTFPLVDASPARVGRLRGYGNAIDAETLTQFIAAYMEASDDLLYGDIA